MSLAIFSLNNLRYTGWRIESRVFTEWRLTLYGSGIAVFYIVVLTSLLLKGLWVFDSDGKISKLDFGYIWASGNLAQSSDPFDSAAFSAAQLSLFGSKSWPLIPNFIYPPTFLLFAYPFGLMPYVIAFAIWMIATLALYQAAIYTIIPRPAALILALTPCPVLLNFGFGQNGFLTAGLVGLSLAFAERRAWLSGVFLGLLTYKPQFGILFPFALLASRNWRALVSAALVSIGLGLITTIAFGYQGWPAFVHSLVNRQSDLGEIPGWHPILVSIFGLLRAAGATTLTSWIVHSAAAVIVATTICIIWEKPIPHSLKAAALSAGSVVVTPYVLGYDLCILSIAAAFLVKDALSRGFLLGERTAMVMCWAGLLFLMAPLIPVTICLVLLFLVVRRIFAFAEIDTRKQLSVYKSDSAAGY